MFQSRLSLSTACSLPNYSHSFCYFLANINTLSGFADKMVKGNVIAILTVDGCKIMPLSTNIYLKIVRAFLNNLPSVPLAAVKEESESESESESENSGPEEMDISE